VTRSSIYKKAITGSITFRNVSRPVPIPKGVVVVNPATSFSRTIWSRIGKYLGELPKPLYTLAMAPIGLLLVDQGQVRPSATIFVTSLRRRRVL